jgi:hypothetical protein
MKRILPLLLLSSLLMAQDCQSPEPPGNFYCSGAVEQPEPTGLDALMVDLLTGIDHVWSTIVGGEPSTDRRSTVFVSIVGVGSCSGVIIGPHTVLTAGHCTGPNGYRIYLNQQIPNYYASTGATIHPGFWRWNSNRGDPHDDLMLIYVKETLPEPYAFGFYNYEINHSVCTGLVAQGWGQTEDPSEPNYTICPDTNDDGKPDSRCLRETPYTVTLVGDTWIKTKGIPGEKQGFICFGDSGGPLYAIVQGQVQLAGITSTTDSTDCKIGSTHVRVKAYTDWIVANMDGPGT